MSINDFKNAFHSLSKAKSYVITIVLSLGITLGALVAMFNLNYQLLAAPLPYPNADRLVVAKSERFDKQTLVKDRHAPYPAWIESYRQADAQFEQKALLAYTVSIERRMPDSPVLNTISTTPEFFNMVQAPMKLGRRFGASEALDTMNPVAVISHRAWVKYFQQDPNVLSKTLNIMEIDFKIIGVLDENFVEPELYQRGWETDVWLPMDYDDMPVQFRKNWNNSIGYTFWVGLLQKGADKMAAEQSISSRVAARFKDETVNQPELSDASLRFRLETFSAVILGSSSQQSLLMLAGVLVLLLIAATNVLNLILARTANQQRSMAIQVALGAQQKHIFSAVLAEISLLMLGASLLAVVVALSLLELLKIAAEGQLPRLQELHINPVTLVFTVLVAGVLATLFALIVSRQINYRQLNKVLQTSGKGVGLQISVSIRKLLILSQVALTAVLLAASLQILLQSSRQLTQPVGYHTSDQYQVLFSIATLWGSTTEEERRAYVARVIDDLRANPKVLAVGATSLSPISYRNPSSDLLRVDGLDDKKLSAVQSYCDGSYLQVAAIPLVAGRYFTDAEVREHAQVMVVNETLARAIQADGQVLGKKVYRQNDEGAQAIEIVGVLKDLQLPGMLEPSRFFQAFVTQNPELVVRVKAGQQLTPTEINALSAKTHPQLKIFYMKTTEQAIAQLTMPQKTAAGLTAALSLIALGLAAIGIYGVLSYSVQLRKFELGIRMAIGARPNTVFLQVLKDNLTPVIIGLVIALVALIGLWIWIQQTSYSLQTTSLGWLLPPVLIISLTAATSLLSVWQIIRKPASYVLRGD
jgi:putative ABC transport system permease protein